MTDIRDQLRAMPSSLNDACRTMEAAADQIDRMGTTVDVLEANARVQAKLLADTARQRDALVKALEEEREYWAGESTSAMLLGLPDNGTIQDRIERISRALDDVGTVQVSGGENG